MESKVCPSCKIEKINKAFHREPSVCQLCKQCCNKIRIKYDLQYKCREIEKDPDSSLYKEYIKKKIEYEDKINKPIKH